MGKRFSTRSIKKERQYTYEDLANELGVTSQTIRAWGKLGLRIFRDGRPHFIVGEDLIAFHKARAEDRPKPPKDRFRCFRCQERVRPLGNVVFYTPFTPKRGQMEALCERCEGPCFRFAGEATLPALAKIWEVVRC